MRVRSAPTTRAGWRGRGYTWAAGPKGERPMLAVSDPDIVTGFLDEMESTIARLECSLGDMLGQEDRESILQLVRELRLATEAMTTVRCNQEERRRVERLAEHFPGFAPRSEEHTSELQSQSNLVCRLLLEKKK